MRRNKINSCTFIQTFNFLQKQIPNISNNEIISILAKSSKKVKDALTFTQYRNTNIDFDLSKLKPIIHAIKNKQPIELILNKPIKYMDIKIDINNRVFIPRVETQEVIIHAIKLIKKEKPKTVIDLCCGSGVIGLMIKKKCKNIDVTCNDINHKCINLTKKNAKNNYLQIRTNCQDCYEFLRQRKNKAEFIIMNPPYLAKNEVTNELIKYEEKISFNNAKNGYWFYEYFIDNYASFVNSNKFVAVFEIGHNQKKHLMNILNKTIFKDSYQFYNDLNNKNRILIINYINKNNIVREVMQEKIKNIKNKNKRDHILYKQLKNIQLSKKMLIALYYPIPRIEPNIINYIKYLLKNNYRVCLPVIENNFFGFRLIKSIDFKKIKLFNKIMQPAQSNPFCMIKDIRTIFAPCVAFNKNNFRLGHGSNFYNKILHKTKNITKYLLAYREQENNEFNVKNNYIKFNKTITC